MSDPDQFSVSRSHAVYAVEGWRGSFVTEVAFVIFILAVTVGAALMRFGISAAGIVAIGILGGAVIAGTARAWHGIAHRIETNETGLRFIFRFRELAVPWVEVVSVQPSRFTPDMPFLVWKFSDGSRTRSLRRLSGIHKLAAEVEQRAPSPTVDI